MTELEELYNAMLVNLEKGIDDLEKFEEGNMSAGTLVRKTMHDVKELAKTVRLEVKEQEDQKKITANVTNAEIINLRF